MTEEHDPWATNTPREPDPYADDWQHWLSNCWRHDDPLGDPHPFLERLVGGGPTQYGVDGDAYKPYVYDHPFDPFYAVVIDRHDAFEEIKFPRDDVPDNQRGDGVLVRWLNDRLDTAARPLQQAPAYHRTRLDAEEAVLAHLLAHPEDVASLRWLPAATFTGELRRTAYAILHDLHVPGRNSDVNVLINAVRDRMPPLTPEERSYRPALDTGAYLHRLAVTGAEPAAAMAIAAELHEWDLRQSLRTQAAFHLHHVALPGAPSPGRDSAPEVHPPHQTLAPPDAPQQPRTFPRHA